MFFFHSIEALIMHKLLGPGRDPMVRSLPVPKGEKAVERESEVLIEDMVLSEAGLGVQSRQLKR